MRVIPILLGAAFLAACSGANNSDMAAADSTAAPTMSNADPDAVTQGGGVPSGYMGQVDPPREGREPADISQAEYTVQDGRWEVRTGPAHIVWAAGDTASGNYTVSTTLDQLETPAHPEAYGMIIGGSNLDQLTGQTYTYFIVRHTGEYMIRVREGATTRTVAEWTKSPAVPVTGEDGKASYALSARVDADSVHFMVGDQEAAAVARATVPTDGIFGVRINHNLHVMVTPPTVTR